MDEFNPSRLTLARMRRGLNKSQLAELVDVTPRSLTEYEAGRTVPSDATLERLAATLSFPRAFFYAPEIETPSDAAVSFRALTSMTAAQRDAALASGALALALARWIEARFDLPAANVPDLRGTPPEEAAAALRERWGLGVQSVRSVVHLLERHGVRVFSLTERVRELDAFSLWHGATPYCFLNTMKSVEHSRFDGCHELGHLALHRHGEPHGREAEHEADAFASAFLMPRSTVLAHVPRGVTLPQLIKLKRVWGVSTAALAHRSHKLGVLTDWQYRSICIEMQERGYRTREPEAIANREASQVLDKVFTALAQDGVSKRRVAAEMALHTADLDALVFGLVITSVDGGGTGGGSKPGSQPKLRLVTSG